MFCLPQRDRRVAGVAKCGWRAAGPRSLALAGVRGNMAACLIMVGNGIRPVAAQEKAQSLRQVWDGHLYLHDLTTGVGDREFPVQSPTETMKFDFQAVCRLMSIAGTPLPAYAGPTGGK